jgi:hypothetical protein
VLLSGEYLINIPNSVQQQSITHPSIFWLPT